MSEYNHRVTIERPANEVFQFVSKPENMPRYLPTVHDATSLGEDRVVVAGKAAGHPYRNDGWFEVDETSRTMKWGSDGENRYRGDLRVEDLGDRCEVAVHLSFEPRPDQEKAFQAQMGSRDRVIDEGLEDALESIRNICEGTGGKVPNQAERRYLG